MTAPDLREAHFWLRLRAREPAIEWENAREAVEDAWRNGAQAATERLELLERQRESLARDPKLPRTPAARRGIDQALDARRAEYEALRVSPEIRRYRQALETERLARKKLAAAAPYEWRGLRTPPPPPPQERPAPGRGERAGRTREAGLPRLRRDRPAQWRDYVAREQAAGRKPVTPRAWKSLFPGSGAD